MEDFEILVETKNEEQDFKPYINVEHLKGIKETSQVFLRVNGFDISKEPDFTDLTEEQFIKYVESNTNQRLVEKFKDLFEENFRSTMSNIYTHKESGNTILIFFLPTSETRAGVGIDSVKNFCKLLVILGCNEGVMISEKPLTSRSREELESSNIKNYCTKNVYNVASYVDEMFINIVDHCLSPKVVKIYRGDELKKFEEENKTDTNFFPRIFINDPVAKFYRARVGDVIMMQRKTGTTTTLIRDQIVYRKVVYAISKDVRK
jgi:DNA-directed RNA polymerase subunit H (RpoH/RPB5)